MKQKIFVFIYLSLIAAGLVYFLETATRIFYGNVFFSENLKVGSLKLEMNSFKYKKALAEKIGDQGLLEFIYLQNIDVISDLRCLPLKKAEAGQEKILFIGDSVLFGAGLSNRHTFSAILDKKIEELKIYNAGKAGANIYQIYVLFSYFYKKIKPDIVVYSVCGNDNFPAMWLDERVNKEHRSNFVVYPNFFYDLDDKGELSLKPKLPFQLEYSLYKYSLFRLLCFKLLPKFYNETDLYLISKNYTNYYSILLNEVYKQCEKDDVKFLMFYPVNSEDKIPVNKDVHDSLKKCNKDQINMLRLKKKYFFQDGVHLNANGHIKAAEYLVPILNEHID